MLNEKAKIIHNLCYTDLVYGRINKKLNTDLSKKQIEDLIRMLLQKTDNSSISKIGKNYYVTNLENGIRITINSNTFRIITVDKIRK